MTSTTTLLLSLFLFGGTAGTEHSTPINIYQDKYFTKKIREAVDRANLISTTANPYSARYPTIDISSWLDPSSSTGEERQEVVHQVLEQTVGAGSFNFIGHNITVELLDQLERSTAKFFSQSIDFKRQYSSALSMAGAGYVANMEQKHGATIYKSDNPRENEGDMRELFTTVYPPSNWMNIRGPGYIQKPLDEFIEKLQSVELALTKIFSSALSLAKGVDLSQTYLSDAKKGSTGALRALRYPAMPKEYDDANKLSPHSDIGTLTILYSQDKGLEEVRDGKWIEVPMEQGELHVTVGQAYHMWSNGLFTDNVHRVSSQAVKDRVSFAYFVAQGQHFIEGIEPICATDESPKFSRASSAEHLND